jgi:general L-amino acid transport system substrate-binding protein
MRFAKSGLAVLMVALTLSLPLAVFAGETLDAVKARGYLVVGVNGGLYGFGMPDEKGVWRGLDVDTGRAIATAIFGDPDKIKYPDDTDAVYRPAVQGGGRPVPQCHPDAHA